MEGERKKREAQDHMEKLKIKKELAQKAAEVCKARFIFDLLMGVMGVDRKICCLYEFYPEI